LRLLFIAVGKNVSARTVTDHVFIRILAIVLATVASSVSGACSAASGTASSLPAIVANENRVAAGEASGKIVRISLVARMGLWYPDGPGTLGIPIAAFGEAGKPLEIPGPLVRVPAGTTVELRLRNALSDRTLRIHGLLVDSNGDHPVVVRRGETRTIRFRRDAPGTYGYSTADERDSFRSQFDADAALVGAIVVDDPQRPRPDDRVFVIGAWDNVWRPDGSVNFGGELLTINGRAWPATERLTYVRGQTVAWRVYNASIESHPMHLHGFPFTLDAVGDGLRATSFAHGPTYREVTHRIAAGQTFDAHWVADRSGMWMFHCHLTVHTMPHPPTAELIAGKLAKRSIEARVHRPDDYMGGMMMAVRVLPAKGDVAVSRPTARRKLDLDVVELPKPENAKLPFDHFAYVLHDDGAAVPASGGLGPPIVLTAGEPVAIAVTNHLREATTVHWHGMPVQQSVDDGGGMHGMGDMPGMGVSDSAPPIAPGGSFVAQFTPPYAGTFMYHTHMDDTWQLIGGLSGPLIVLPAGAHFDPTTDHIVMLTSPVEAPLGDTAAIDGFVEPPPMVVHVGVPQRFRLINMTALNSDLIVSLDGPGAPVWTPIAKDGLDLDPRLRIPRRAVQQLTIGETRDFTFVPATPGHLTFDVFDGPQIGAMRVDVVP
jgi:FtsP/CotA-like multicopper oxidase with cupredoxin domain